MQAFVIILGEKQMPGTHRSYIDEIYLEMISCSFMHDEMHDGAYSN